MHNCLYELAQDLVALVLVHLQASPIRHCGNGQAQLRALAILVSLELGLWPGPSIGAPKRPLVRLAGESQFPPYIPHTVVWGKAMEGR